MKDLDSSLIWEIYDKWKTETPLAPENIEREWTEFSSNMIAKFPKLDMKFGDIDYNLDNGGEVIRIIMEPITLFFDFPESEKHYKVLQKAVKSNPTYFEIITSDMGFMFNIKDQKFLSVRRQAVYSFIEKILSSIDRIQ